MTSDSELLQRYAEDRDERAFTELVERHLPLVYAAACRRVGGRAEVAEGVAQQVFCDLARKSHTLVRHPSLIGWLYRSTRYVAIDALRAEQRRSTLAERAAASPDLSDPEPSLDVERLRPLLDAAMDDLKEVDRQVVLMRYFSALSFGEIGQRLGLAENTARMRTERSLEKLRALLARRGLTSTAATLAVALGSEACASAPVGVALAVARSALAIAPIGGSAGPVTLLLMSKFTAPVVSGLVAAGLTAVVWTASTDGVSAADLAALRAEQQRLEQATAPDAPPTAVAAVAEAYAARATAIAAAMDQRQVRRAASAAGGTRASSSAATLSPEVTARGHSDHGTATPEDAALTFAWACDIADPDELARIITFDADGRQAAHEALATMPEGVRALYPTPEAFYGMLLAAACLEAPPPGADVMRLGMTMVELSPDRYAGRRVGSTRNNHEYQRVDGVWKYVVPAVGVKSMPSLLNSETLVRLSER